MALGHLDPLRAWSVGGEQFRWFQSGAAPSTEIEQPDLRGSRVRSMRRPTLPGGIRLLRIRWHWMWESAEGMGIGLDFSAVQRSQAGS